MCKINKDDTRSKSQKEGEKRVKYFYFQNLVFIVWNWILSCTVVYYRNFIISIRRLCLRTGDLTVVWRIRVVFAQKHINQILSSQNRTNCAFLYNQIWSRGLPLQLNQLRKWEHVFVTSKLMNLNGNTSASKVDYHISWFLPIIDINFYRILVIRYLDQRTHFFSFIADHFVDWSMTQFYL